jgi:hypothetical protein
MALYTGSYSVSLIENNDRRGIIPLSAYGFEFTDEREYIILISNHHTKLKIDASVEIDGKHIGTFRVNSSSQVYIERPVGIGKEQKLTFCKESTYMGRAGGLNPFNHAQGTLVVTISVEKPIEHDIAWSVFQPKGETVCDGPAGTVRGARSSQQFYAAENISHVSDKLVIFAHMIHTHNLNGRPL